VVPLRYRSARYPGAPWKDPAGCVSCPRHRGPMEMTAPPCAHIRGGLCAHMTNVLTIQIVAVVALVLATLVTVLAVRRRRAAASLHVSLAEQEALSVVLRQREVTYRGLASEQAALRRVAMSVAGQASPTGVLDMVAEEAARLLDGTIGQVCRFSGTRALVVGSWGDGALERGGWFSLYGSSLMAQIVRGKATRVDDYGALEGRDPAGNVVVHPSQYGAVASPIWVSSELWGVVVVVSSRSVSDIPAAAEARLGRFAELVTLAVAAAEERDRLQGLATSDPLTGLPNRRAFDHRLAAEAERSARHGHALSVVILDIDHFKRVNDTWGHQVGDDVLVEFARRLQSQARGSDLVARIGGEEFAWLLADAPAAGARDAAERLRRYVAAQPFPTFGVATFSAGVADVSIAGCEPSELLRVADEALYQAKQSGRDRTAVGAPDISPHEAPSRG
jgi:diguanylate cyclase (GGDEF)-like protein